jgi:hypothetical protein
MRRSFQLGIAAGAIVLFAGVSHAQIRGGFGQRQTTVLQVRNGPLNSFNLFYSGPALGFGSIYGPVPVWYYGQPGMPIINNPYTVQPPIVIQNIVQAPAIAAPARPGVIPAEFDPAKPAPRGGRQVAMPPVAPPPVIVPEPKAAMPLGRADADRVSEAGHKAFSDGQYGRALELFRRAAELTPNEPSVQYLISQAYFALGKYREAVAAIAAGMALRADWADARFVSRDLYWKKPEIFDEHLKLLRQAVEQFPADASLLFLLGHELWFDGKREEARAIILKARQFGKDQSPAAAFRVEVQ